MIQVGIGHKLSCHLSSSNLKGGHLLAVLLLCKRENPWLWISKSLISSASVPHTCRTRSCQIACRPRFCQRNVFHLMWDSTQTDHVSCPCFSTSLSARKSPVAVWQVDGGTRSLWISILPWSSLIFHVHQSQVLGFADWSKSTEGSSDASWSSRCSPELVAPSDPEWLKNI